MELKMTINCKPMTADNIKATLEQAVFNAAVEQMKQKVSNAITAAEAAQISIDVQGTDLKNLGLKINGPKEIVNKINKALS
jgi:hypothetical protein